MLRNRSRNLTSKQSLMADHNSVPSPRSNQTKPLSSFFGTPINGFFSKGNNNIFGAETVMSPTSILDNQTVSNFGNPFGYYDQKKSESQKTSSSSSSAVNKQFNEKLHSKGIYLALIDSTNDEKNHDNFNFTKPKLKIQIPTFPPSGISPTQSTKSPADFGIKTWNRNLSTFGGLNSCATTMDSSNISTGGLSLSEMELSEEYTCVISRGPNPKTTRIYDNCILESCCGGVALSELKKEFNSPSKSFISFCHTCKKNLGDGKDIYMYRGEKAFCSNECRCKEML